MRTTAVTYCEFDNEYCVMFIEDLKIIDYVFVNSQDMVDELKCCFEFLMRHPSEFMKDYVGFYSRISEQEYRLRMSQKSYKNNLFPY